MSMEDRAQEHEAHVWELNNVHRKQMPPVAQPGDPRYGPEECEECGDDMPEVRRSYGFKLCTQCQSAIEALRRR